MIGEDTEERLRNPRHRCGKSPNVREIVHSMSAKSTRVTRRNALEAGAAALGGGAALLSGGASAAQNAQAPAVLTGSRRAGRSAGSSATTARSTSRRCGSADRPAAGGDPFAGGGALLHDRARRARHQLRSGAPRCRTTAASASSRPWAPMVKRVQVGDRVVVAGTSQCGQCYQCLQGRPGLLPVHVLLERAGRRARFPPFAELRDGTPVYAQAGIGGMSEVMTAFEEYCVPVFTDLPAAQLTLLGDQLASGFAAGHADMQFRARLRRGGVRRRPGRSWRGAGRPRDGRRPGDRDRSDQVPPRVRAEDGRDDDARSGGGRRRHRRARARAVPGTERSAVRRRRHLGPGRQCRHGARRGLRRRGRRACRRFRRRSRRSPTRPT